MNICCCGGAMGRFYTKMIERLTGGGSPTSDQNGNSHHHHHHLPPAPRHLSSSHHQIETISGSSKLRAQSGSPALNRKKRPEVDLIDMMA